MHRLREWLRRELLTLMLAGALIAAILNCALAPHGIKDLIILRHHRTLLEAEREHQQAENHDLQSTIQKLQSNDAYLQRLIRKELGFVHSNELIYRFADHQTAHNPP